MFIHWFSLGFPDFIRGRSGFWTGTGAGGLFGYLLGRQAGETRRRTRLVAGSLVIRVSGNGIRCSDNNKIVFINERM